MDYKNAGVDIEAGYKGRDHCNDICEQLVRYNPCGYNNKRNAQQQTEQQIYQQSCPALSKAW